MKRFIKKVATFVKRNIYAVIVVSAMIALILTVAITAVIKNQNQNAKNSVVANIPSEVVSHVEDIDEQITPVSAQPQEVKEDPEPEPKPIIFYAPLETYTIGMGYNMDGLIYNKTLKEWSTHSGIDYIAESGSDVLSAYAGEIESIDYSILDGTVVVIKHNDNLKSVYKSLANNITLNVGDKVERGQKIGEISDSMTTELKEGAHLHFEVIENGEYVDPNNYISANSK